jgi:hypothetical protein
LHHFSESFLMVLSGLAAATASLDICFRPASP